MNGRTFYPTVNIHITQILFEAITSATCLDLKSGRFQLFIQGNNLLYQIILYQLTNLTNMFTNSLKTSAVNASIEKRSKNRTNLNHTPSKKNKYDNFTPRKRYMKEHDEYDNYRNFQYQPAESFQQHAVCHFEPKEKYSSHNRNGSISKWQSLDLNHPNKYQLKDIYSPNFEKMFSADNRQPLKQYTFNPNCPTSVRQIKFKNYAAGKQISKKITFDENQNKDRSNMPQARTNRDHLEAKQRFLDIQSQYCSTPRRLSVRKDENPGEVNQKLSLIQAKIARLERMTPKRCSVPKVSHVIETTLPEFLNNLPPEKQDPKPESTVSSRESVVSQRQNQIMSRVSLGRLVEQQECQTEIQVIQDLSYKISSKLRSIIRNFG